jgi:hypothetical protein
MTGLGHSLGRLQISLLKTFGLLFPPRRGLTEFSRCFSPKGVLSTDASRMRIQPHSIREMHCALPRRSAPLVALRQNPPPHYQIFHVARDKDAPDAGPNSTLPSIADCTPEENQATPPPVTAFRSPLEITSSFFSCHPCLANKIKK